MLFSFRTIKNIPPGSLSMQGPMRRGRNGTRQMMIKKGTAHKTHTKSKTHGQSDTSDSKSKTSAPKHDPSDPDMSKPKDT